MQENYKGAFVKQNPTIFTLPDAHNSDLSVVLVYKVENLPTAISGTAMKLLLRLDPVLGGLLPSFHTLVSLARETYKTWLHGTEIDF